MAYREGMTYYRAGSRRTQGSASGTLVSPRQMAALDKMAAANGFTSGSALLADVASCTAAELGRKSRPVVQMFVDQAFTRYGRTSRRGVEGALLTDETDGRPRFGMRGRCEDAPACGCCD